MFLKVCRMTSNEYYWNVSLSTKDLYTKDINDSSVTTVHFYLDNLQALWYVTPASYFAI